MSESTTKTFVFPECQGSGMLGYLAPMLQKQGIDPNLLLAMNNGNCGNNGNWFIWILFILFLFRNNGYGNEGNLANMINNDSGRELLMSAINGNSSSIERLSSQLNCSANSIQNAVNSVATQVMSVGNQVGMTAQQVINSIQAGNASLASQLCQNCCSVKETITNQGYQNQLANERQTYQLTESINSVGNRLERGFSQVGYESQAQTCALQNTIKDTSNSSTNAIIAKLDLIQSNALQDKIDSLREANSNLKTQINLEHQNAYNAQVISQAVAPINQAIAGLQKEVSDIQCKLPNTVTLPYSCATAVPTSMVYGAYGINNTGVWG